MDRDQSDDPQLPYLATFSKAAELSSFTGAAKALRLTQASVSQRVQALERTLGTPLFKRQGGRVLLTEAGKKLYDYAQRILDLHGQARREITGREAPPGGELSLAASSIPGEHLLPSLLSLFGKKHAHIRIRATVSDSMGVMTQVERGEVNFGLVGRKTDNPHLEFRYLASDKMVLVVPPDHALSRRKKLSVKQLDAQDRTLYSVLVEDIALDNAFVRVGPPPPDLTLVPANLDLADTWRRIAGRVGLETLLKTVLAPVLP